MPTSDILFQAGEYEVRVVDINDTRIPQVDGKTATGKGYGIIHTPTGVLNGTTQIMYVAIRGAWQLNDELQKARKNPGEQDEGPQGFGAGLPGFG